MSLRVLTALPFGVAQVVKGALEAEGVAVTLDRPGLASIYGSGTWPTRLLVPEEEWEHARRLLHEFNE